VCPFITYPHQRIHGDWGFFSRDGTRFLVGSFAGQSLEVWNWRKGVRMHRFELLRAARLNCGALSPDDRLLAIGDAEGVVWLVDIATGTVLREFEGHREMINGVAFSSDGSGLVSASEDSTALIWDVIGKRETKGLTGRLSAEEMANLWRQLADDDLRTAYQAIWRLASYPGNSLPWLRSRMRPVRGANPALVRSLVRQLDDESFAQRVKASRELLALGDAVEPLLSDTVNQAGLSPETRSRIKKVLATLERSPERRQLRRALIVLEYIHSPSACDLLRVISRGDPKSWLTSEASSSLQRAIRLRGAPPGTSR
jgi:WD40 repeat protein